MAVRPTGIVYGVFKGMGDLLWAAPVIASEIARGTEVHLLLFPSAALVSFCSLVDFGPNRELLFTHTLPRTMRDAFNFLTRLRRLSPHTVWISPHAPAAASSWRIPFALWAFKKLFWPTAQIVGASSERLSGLFNLALPVDRTLPLKTREWSMYSMLRKEVLATPPSPRFRSEIMERASEPPYFDIIIHPGAMAKNRMWPHSKYPEVIASLPPDWKIGILGLPEDVAALQQILPADRSIDFITGSLRDALMTIASARLLLVMDSGNVHFAEVLGRPTVALFGKEDPKTIIPQSADITAVYEKSVSCQPCGLATCIQTEPFCLTNISPETVVDRLLTRSREQKKSELRPPSEALITIGNR